uniref:Uncharacterized protein n=1 Tax=Vespula pensylvanica TaxID=30213 RepID=A0A834P194_VESPE|nr:hypothetical protein H0235_007469 [Vespula pensylvanica]
MRAPRKFPTDILGTTKELITIYFFSHMSLDRTTVGFSLPFTYVSLYYAVCARAYARVKNLLLPTDAPPDLLLERRLEKSCRGSRMVNLRLARKICKVLIAFYNYLETVVLATLPTLAPPSISVHPHPRRSLTLQKEPSSRRRLSFFLSFPPLANLRSSLSSHSFYFFLFSFFSFLFSLTFAVSRGPRIPGTRPEPRPAPPAPPAPPASTALSAAKSSSPLGWRRVEETGGREGGGREEAMVGGRAGLGMDEKAEEVEEVELEEEVEMVVEATATSRDGGKLCERGRGSSAIYI